MGVKIMTNVKIKHNEFGFTLVELLIVIAIVGILAAIAYPSYENSVIKSKRTDGMAAVMMASDAYERYHSNPPFTYDVPLATIFPVQVPLEGGTPYYQLTVENLTKTTYTIKATPIGSMLGKDDYLSLTHTGAKKWGDGKDCWPDGGTCM